MISHYPIRPKSDHYSQLCAYDPRNDMTDEFMLQDFSHVVNRVIAEHESEIVYNENDRSSCDCDNCYHGFHAKALTAIKEKEDTMKELAKKIVDELVELDGLDVGAVMHSKIESRIVEAAESEEKVTPSKIVDILVEQDGLDVGAMMQRKIENRIALAFNL